MSFAGKKILIVDDEVDLCELIAWDFQDAGMVVYKAFGGVNALKIIESSGIDYLLTDLKMPNGSGVELIEGIKKLNIELEAIFVMTGYSDYSETALLAMGINKVLKKPIETESIQDFIEKLIKDKVDGLKV
jgi:DNA-binding NtrC family response regulator